MTRTELLRARGPAEIASVVDIIHDQVFDLDRVLFDRDRHELSIPFDRTFYEDEVVESSGWFGSARAPVYECWLIIRNVTDVVINDTQRVGTYNFSDIKLDLDNGAVAIETGIPLEFLIRINELDASIERLGTPVRFKKYRVLHR